jgi:hypothetical protein
MALPLTRLDAYGPDRQASMRAALGYVQRGAESNDLREVVDKAL